ncbi:DUF2975 domain-containing protein [Streptococcus merionis]|uniref:Membrane protein n=1 Tax=Streptococcus merionis TaxID=400065 RepID=A0A239SZ08_9STRE|nr:DUF2975 domain-containing protein [Streptococcus merionis]SNU90492.1 membrane protein [Streptococcus merionis]
MKDFILKLVFIIAKAAQYGFAFIAGSICIGIVATMILGDKIWQYTPVKYGHFTVFHALLALFVALGIFIIMLYMAICIQKLVRQFQVNSIFISENIQTVHHILFGLLGITGLQLLTALFFRIVHVGHISDTFDFSLGDYWVNLVFIVIAFVAGEVLKRGQQIETDYNEII